MKELAEANNIPVYQPVSLRKEEAQAELHALNADVMVVVAYGLILPEAVLNAPKKGCINIHGSLLPRWRGAAPIQRAIEAGDVETGIAIMQMDKGLDTGAVWSEGKITITETMNSGELFVALKQIGSDLLIETLPTILEGKSQPIPQPEEGVTYAEKLTKEEARINWAEPAELLDRKIRAFNPAPCSHTTLNEQLFKVWVARLTNEPSTKNPGTLEVKDGLLFVNTGSNLMEIITMQVAGKKAMLASEFLKGTQLHLEELK
ncbi:methionyl-tRNA formyltransferase [Wohlfahrtiimonas populi]|uniref:methionyl-tRNA formyltransferase n=1 Tax=Wohlfahrtiimonas populi TaxID=1940240 RepID=UPI0038CD7094